MIDYHELVLGAGTRLNKDVRLPHMPESFLDPTTLDINYQADVRHDLNDPVLPFIDNYFDEIHAYEILEHVGAQGDWKFFFKQFEEFHRVLKPGGYMCGSCPHWNKPWAWGDPGHTRVLLPHTLVFLDRAKYEAVGSTTMTDYRPWYLGNFVTKVVDVQSDENRWFFVLQALK